MPSKTQQGFAPILTVLVIGAVGLVTVASLIPVNRNYNDGKSDVAGVSLAKGGDDGGSSGNGSSGGSNSGSRDSGSSSGGSSGGSSNSGNSGNSVPTTTQAAPKPVKVETKKVETKVETKEVSQNQRIETKTTPEKIKSEIRQGNLRVKFEVENGKVKMETKVKQGENETELQNEAEDEAVKEVEAELEKKDVKISTAPGQVAIVNKRVGALSSLPISIDPTTRQLTVTTPSGSKVVTVLPQQAIDNMLASHVMDFVVGEKVDNELASVPSLVKLEEKDGVLAYKVKGIKTHRLLGFIPIQTGVDAFVSAENGQVVTSTDSLLGRILNRIAP